MVLDHSMKLCLPTLFLTLSFHTFSLPSLGMLRFGLFTILSPFTGSKFSCNSLDNTSHKCSTASKSKILLCGGNLCGSIKINSSFHRNYSSFFRKVTLQHLYTGFILIRSEEKTDSGFYTGCSVGLMKTHNDEVNHKPFDTVGCLTFLQSVSKFIHRFALKKKLWN